MSLPTLYFRALRISAASVSGSDVARICLGSFGVITPVMSPQRVARRQRQQVAASSRHDANHFGNFLNRLRSFLPIFVPSPYSQTRQAASATSGGFFAPVMNATASDIVYSFGSMT